MFINGFFKKALSQTRKYLLSHKYFLSFLIALIAFCYIGLVFYLYIFRFSIPSKTFLDRAFINKPGYQGVMNNIEQRKINFEQEETKAYPDPFK